jgi:WD40 repeat protein
MNTPNLTASQERRDDPVIPRPWLTRELLEWIEDDRSPLLVLQARAGMGKSVVCQEWIRASKDPSTPLSESLLASYVCNHFSVATHSPFAFVDSLTAQALQNAGLRQAAESIAQERLLASGVHVTGHAYVAENFGTAVGVLIENLGTQSAVRALQSQFLDVVTRANLGSEPIVLIDGLDELEYWNDPDSIYHLAWSGIFHESGVRLVVATRSLPKGQRLPLHSKIVDLNAREEDCRRDVAEYVRLRAPLIDPHGRQELVNTSGGNFLYVRFVLDTRSGVSHGGGEGAEAADLHAIYEQHLNIWSKSRDPGVRHQWRHVIRPLLGVLGAAQSPGLTLSQIASALGITQLDASDIVGDAATLLESRVDESGVEMWALSHPSLSDFLDIRYKNLIEESHLSIGRSMVETWSQSWHTCDDLYAITNAAWHLIFAATHATSREICVGAINALSRLVADPSYLLSARQAAFHQLLTMGATQVEFPAEAQSVLSLLRRTYPLLVDDRRSERPQNFALAAEQLGLHEFAEAVRDWIPAGATIPLWARWVPEADFDLVLQLGEPAIHLDILAGGQALAVTQSRIVILDLDRRQLIRTIDLNDEQICVARSASSDAGRLVAVGTKQGEVLLLDLDSGEVLHRLRRKGDGEVTSIRFLPRRGNDSGFDLVVSAQGTTAYANLERGTTHLTTPEGTGGALQIWNCLTGLLTRELVAGQRESYYLIDALSVDDTHLGLYLSDRAFLDEEADNFLTRMGSERSLQLWNLSAGTYQDIVLPDEINIAVLGVLAESPSDVSLVVSFDDDLVADDWEHMAGLFSVSSGELRVLGPIDKDSTSSEITGLNKSLGVIYTIVNDVLRIYNLSNGTPVGSLQGVDSRVGRPVIFEKSGKYTLLGNVEGDLRVWAVRPGLSAVNVSEDHAPAGRLCPLSEKELVVTSGDKVSIHSFETGDSRALFRHDAWGSATVADVKGRARLLDVDSFHNMRIFDVDTEELVISRKDEPWRLRDGLGALLIGDTAFYFHCSKEGDIGVDVFEASGEATTIDLFSIGVPILQLATSFRDENVLLALALQGSNLLIVNWNLSDGTLREVHRFQGPGAVLTMGLDIRFSSVAGSLILAVGDGRGAFPVRLHWLGDEGLIKSDELSWLGRLLDVCSVNREPWILASDDSRLLLGRAAAEDPALTFDVGARIHRAVWVQDRIAVSTPRGLLCVQVPWKASFPFTSRNFLRRKGFM